MPAGGTVDQVAAALALTVREGRTEATVTLRPAALGEVKVRIATGTDGVVIHISAERDAVGELLRARTGDLREALVRQQVPVAELHVLHNPPALPVAEPRPALQWQERPWEQRGRQPTPEEQPDARGQRDEAEED